MHLFTDQLHLFPVEPTMYIVYGIITLANQASDAAPEIFGLPSFIFLHNNAPISTLFPREDAKVQRS